MQRFLNSVVKYFGVTKENYPDLKNQTDALTILYFCLAYAVAWASYLPVYFIFMKNIPAGFAVLLIGLPSSLASLWILKYTRNAKTATAFASVGGGLNLVAIAAATGGAWSSVFSWLFVAITAPFLLRSARFGFTLAGTISILAAVVTIFVDPKDGQGWGFEFEIFGQFHRYYNAFTHFSSLMCLGLVAFIFRDRISSALIESEKAKEEALHKRAEAELANKKTSAVVNSGVGSIATFDKDFKILLRSDDFTKYFGSTLSFIDVLPNLEVKNKTTLEDGLRIIFGTNELSYSLNEAVFPLDGRINGRRHTLKWTPFYDQNGEIVEMVFTAIDNEDSLQNFEAATKNAEDALMMKRLVSIGSQRSSDFIAKGRQFLADAKHYQEVEESRQAYISLHTFKGVSRTLGFDALAEKIHETESSLPNKDKSLQLIAQCFELLFAIDRIASELGFSGDLLIINKKDAHQAISHNREKEYMMDTLYSTLETELMSFTLSIHKIAKDLGKEDPQLTVFTPKIYLQNHTKKAISNAFVHILRNAIDHGLENREERLKAGKSPAGNILVKSSIVENMLHIKISDDGRGLDIRKIYERGLEKGLITKADKINPNDVAELIFTCGFSTAKTLTLVSGRGMGMDAVRSEIEALGGKVYCEVYSDGDFAPWELVIVLPLSVLVREAA